LTVTPARICITDGTGIDLFSIRLISVIRGLPIELRNVRREPGTAKGGENVAEIASYGNCSCLAFSWF
jgi:hypothetical protein